MKWSIFNTILPYEAQYALYNSYSQKVIFISSDLKELLTAALIEGIDNLNQFHPAFYEYLKIHEFLIDEYINEISNVRKISTEIDNEQSNFILTINPTMNCNFKCWYCYETHIKDSRLSEEMICRIHKYINNLTGDDSSISSLTLAFFGGEPLLFFEETVIPIIENAKNACIKRNISLSIGITTNGLLINKKRLDYFIESGLSYSFQITLDGYKDSHDKVRFINESKGSYDEIVKNIRILVQNNFYVRVRINYTDKNINDSYMIVEDFIDLDDKIKEEYLTFDFHRVWQNTSDVDIEEDVQLIIDLLRKKGFTVHGKHSLNNIRESCYADKRNSVLINYNGDIYKCTARDFTKENRSGYLKEDGILCWENDNLEKRMNIKFKNNPCLSCRILPLCGGGCTQHAIEREDIEYCLFKGGENEKDLLVKGKIDDILRS